MLTKYSRSVLLTVVALLASVPTSILAQDGGTFANLTVLPAPATPTTTSLNPGPPLPSSDLNAQPLPPGPNPALGSTVFQLDLLGNGTIAGIPVPANFLGISVELSVATDIFGSQLSNLYAPFLNYVASISERLPQQMGPRIRVGGNTQDRATYNSSAAAPIVKDSAHGFNLTTGAPITPDIQVGSKLFDIMSAIGNSLRIQWVYGVNMGTLNAADFNQPMVKDVTNTLGDSLQMLLVGNEPDRYAITGRRDSSYTIAQYLDEWDEVTSSIRGEVPTQKYFVAPSVCCAWTTNEILVDNGMADRFKDRLAAVSGIKYPQSLCSVIPVQGHSFYLNHSNTVEFAKYDEDAVRTSVALGLPFVLIETNTASCIGVKWVSDAFSSTLWAIDSALQLAFRNHSGMYLHTAGQSVLYNLFTPPTYREALYTAWRTGPIMYALPFVAEALNSTRGRSARVRDLGMRTPNGSVETAVAYGIYEDDDAQVASRVVLMNLVGAPGDDNALRVNIPVGSQDQVLVKFLAAPSAAEQENITWAGQTFGYYSNGELRGTESIQQLQCNSGDGDNNNFCVVTVPAPGAAIVFLTNRGQSLASVASRSMSAFDPQGTADPGVVIDSNGSRGRKGGATSRNSARSGTIGGPAGAKAAHQAVWLCLAAGLTSVVGSLLARTLQL
ncbi:unnamed protein product [Tilletia laevis]|uniref:Beta-glucuronidase C-terminal domain-containing protein n=2 Tax=Tilletia TaxID=13289 RepID=A0A177UXM4_9BASI|nr:hypothetical protein CF336_g1123 [Tilletia laevis]KAE8263170.1 hypothetical protein A4X03_0g1886 [Tilletia caries]KAE8206722.1 hypothetical protein CF335_g1663 [Tilletia laevis]CAD6885756.1 unnamed protein product [Tilletia caries]CAD6903200.1 unnamed protein product [Tilletia laevis]